MVLRWAFSLFHMLTVSSLYDECFVKFQKRSLMGSAQLAIENSTIHQCLTECLRTERFQCRSVLYYVNIHACVLNNSDKKHTPSMYSTAYANRTTSDYYHRTCYAPEWAMDATMLSTCFTIIRDKVLIGVVDRLIQDISSQSKCQKLCLNSKRDNNIICKAAMYYPKEEECIITSDNRYSMPDLYIDDEGAFYMENECADGEMARIDLSESLRQNIPSNETLKPIVESVATIQAPLASTPSLIAAGIFKSADFSDLYGGDDLIEVNPATTPKPRGEDDYENLVEPTPGLQQPIVALPASGEPVPALGAYSGVKSTAVTSSPTEIGTFQITSSIAPPTAIVSPLSNERAQKVEMSGYGVTPVVKIVETLKTTENPVPTIDANIIDTYGFDTKGSNAAESFHRFSRILHDPVNSSCFRQIYPLQVNFELVLLSYSLDQCMDICRLCSNCLQNKRKCIIVGFSIYTNHCALSSIRPREGSAIKNEDGALVYYRRRIGC